MRRIILSLFIAFFVASPARAQTTEGTLQFLDKTTGVVTAAPGIASDIKINIDGTIARATITQYFLNNTDLWQEGVYTYPLPDDAAVDSLVMMIGEKRIIGFVHEKKQARQIYEQAKAAGKAASLAEQHRTNIFKTAVANIPPRSMIAIEIQHQAPVRLDDYVFSYRMPMAITPRYDEFSPEELMSLVSSAGQGWAEEVVDRLRLTGFAGGKNPVHLNVTLAPGFTVTGIKSASHDIDVDKAKGLYRIALKDEIIPGERDFVLSWQPEKTDKTISALHYEELDGNIYSQLLILPPKDLKDVNTPAPKRQVTYIIDTSGSMAGPSIIQAREALVRALEDLTPDDYFNIIAFNSFHTKLFQNALPGTEENIRNAVKLVRELEADGGTVMIPAVEEAFAETLVPGLLRQIVFITDGAIGYEAKMAALIKQRAGNARFYAIGIGAAPNAHLMRTFAEAGRGTFTFIGNVEEVSEKLGALFRKMKSPVLTDLKLIVPDGVNATIIPAKLPDLMAGEPVSVAIKSDRIMKNIAIKGIKGEKEWRFSAAVTTPRMSEGVSKIYARRRIQELSQNDPGGINPQTRAEILALGIEHQIMSAYTSFVAVDEEIIRPQHEIFVQKHYDPTLPAGWQQDRLESRDASRLYREHLERKAAKTAQELKQEINLPQTATGYELSLLAGLLMLLLSLLMLGTRRAVA